MLERLNEIEKKYEELGLELTKPETLQNVDLLTKLSKEQRKLEETVTTYRKYKSTINSIKEDEELLKDDELKDIAKEELQALEVEKEQLEQIAKEEIEILNQFNSKYNNNEGITLASLSQYYLHSNKENTNIISLSSNEKIASI